MVKSLSELNSFFREFLSAKAFKEEEIKLKVEEEKEGKTDVEKARAEMGIESGF